MNQDAFISFTGNAANDRIMDEPENVFTGAFNHFIHVRLWFGGGESLCYAVDSKSQSTLVDKVGFDN